MYCFKFEVFLILLGCFVAGRTTAELKIITKLEWKGQEARADLIKLELPVRRVVIMHTAGAFCNDEESCAFQARNIQQYQMNTHQFDDIGYNFLVGNDGNVYEGRGWDEQGAFARGFNAGSVGVAFIGTFNNQLPTDAAIAVAKSLLEEGIRWGKIAEDYKLLGHRQLAATVSPGEALYAAIRLWPHWSRQTSI